MSTLKTKTDKLAKKVRAQAQPEVEARKYDWALMMTEAAGEEIDPGDYTLPRSSVDGLIAVATHLAAQAPSDLTPALARALREMMVARDMAEAHSNEAEKPVVREIQGPRNEVVKMIGAHARTLGEVAASGMEQAQEAGVLQERLFGRLTNLRDLESREYWSRVERVRKVLIEEPALRAQLATLVSPAITSRLFEVHAELGEALGMTARDEAAPRIAMVQVQAFLRRRIRRYVVQMLASSGDTLDERRALAKALEPVTALRERSRRARGELAEEVAETAEEVIAPAAPVAVAPVAPAAVMPVAVGPVVAAPVAVAPVAPAAVAPVVAVPARGGEVVIA